MPTILTLVRHGEMPLNRKENMGMLIKEGVDGPLTPRGIAEAEALGKVIENEKFTRVFASEFCRARQTAENVLKHSKHPVPNVVIDKRISERDSGDWVNKTPMDMYQEAVKVGTYPHFLPCPGGETVEEVIARASSFLEEICTIADSTPENQTENILAATHGAWLAHFIEVIIKNEAKYTAQGCFEPSLARQPAPTTGVTQIEIQRKLPNDNQPRILKFLKLHDQSHLNGVPLPE